MKFLVLAACVAVSSAQGFFGLQAHPNGAVTPIDEPRVAAARADHLATKFGAGLGYAGYGAGLGYAGYAPGYAAGYGYSGYAAAAPLVASAGLGYAGYAPYAAGYGYAGPLNLNRQLVAHPNGAVVPVDEPAVAAARADHLASKGVAYAAAAPLIASALVAAPLGYAGYAPYAAGYGYAGPLNLNRQLVAHPNGAVVPVDEPAVAAARADHLASKGVAYAAAPLVAAAPAFAAAPLVASAPYAAVGYGYGGPLNLNTQLVAHPNGAVVPVDEPAVAAARAEHLAIKGVYGGVYAAAAPAAYAAGYGAGYAPYAGLVAHPNGAVVPVDEPAVAAARAEHLASKGVAYAAAAPFVAAAPAFAAAPLVASAPYAAVGYGYGGPLNLNTQLVAHPNGAVVPVDEPAVAAARADHLATKGVYGGVYAAAAPAAYAAGYGVGYAPYAGLVAHPNGAVVPVDEPAVAAARADHLAAHGY